MKKWKEVIDRLIPEDVLVGGYVWEVYNMYRWEPVRNDVIDILKSIANPKDKTYFRYCKPEEKTLITRSGKTFVAYDRGINYLCIKPDYYMPSIILDNNDSIPDFYNTDLWKPFTDKNGKHVDENGNSFLELTDEIAKLRPMVINDKQKELHIFYGVHKGFAITMNNVDAIDSDYIAEYLHLATAHELELT